MFAIKSPNDLLINLNELKNSIGKNNKKSDAKNINKLQNRLCPDHVVINLSEKKDIYGKEVVSKQLKDHFNFFKNTLLKFLDDELVFIGSCSTVTTLCAVHKRLDFFDLSKIEGHFMNRKQFLNTIYFIENLNVTDLKKMPCVGSRYKLLLNGIEILNIILDIFPINKVIASQNGLREGMLRNLILANEKN